MEDLAIPSLKISALEKKTLAAEASVNPFSTAPLPMLRGGKPVQPTNRYQQPQPSMPEPIVPDPVFSQPITQTVQPMDIVQEVVQDKPKKKPGRQAKEQVYNPIVESRTAEGLPSYRCEFEGRDIFVAWPWYKFTNPVTAAVNVAMALDFGRDKIRFDMAIGDAKIEHSRNRLAHKFLETDARWMLMMDDDIIPSIGRPAWFRHWVAGARNVNDAPLQRHVLHRLMGAGKTLVAGAYFGRQEGGALMCSDPSLATRARAYEDRVLEVDWVGTGCILIHRRVFEDIRVKFGDSLKINVPDYDYDYFRPFDSARGEDVSFCIRAKEAGHQPHIDLGIPVFHVGVKTY